MCGIVGLMQWNGQPVDPSALKRMSGVLKHRGPDAEGIKVASAPPVSVGFGHTRLKVIDLSERAAQPMANDDGSIWVTFNGEIYNYQSLRAQLQSRGVRFRSASDTEVILRLYEADGERCLEQLDGMFAFAIWDARSRSLLLGRDRVGKKPLFYTATPKLFAFASESKALFQHPEIDAAVDDASLPAFFLYGYVPTPATCYRGVRSVPPGHWLRVEQDGTQRLERYWDVPVLDGPAVSEAEATAKVRELVTEAVRRRLITDVPLGAFLSGGLDSSIVVGVMSRLMKEPVRTFSIGFAGDQRFDETAYAQAVSRHFKTSHTEFIVEPSAVELVEKLVWHHDGPFADSSAIPTYLLSKMTRQHVTVALNGDGGDELFAGYNRFPATLLSERVPAWLRRSTHGLLSVLPEWGDDRHIVRRLQKLTSGMALPFHERYSRWISVFYDDHRRLLTAARGAGNGAAPAALALLEPHLTRSASASPLSRLLHLNLKTYLLDDLLVKMDRCSMAQALETRSPFLDRALIEYAFSLPDEMKLRLGRTKVVLRRAFGEMLPADILKRGKMGFGVPLRQWFKTSLRDYLQDLLLAPDAKLRAYVDQAYVRQLCEEHAAGRIDASHRLWTLLTFEVWLRQMPVRKQEAVDACA